MKLKIKPIEPADIGALRIMIADFVEEGALDYPIIDSVEMDKAMMPK